MDLHRLTNLFTSLSHPTRAKIFFTVYESPEALHSGAIAGILDLKEGVVSHHLTILYTHNLLSRHQVGKFAFFTVNKRTLFELANFFYSLVGGDTKPVSEQDDTGFSEQQFFRS